MGNRALALAVVALGLVACADEEREDPKTAARAQYQRERDDQRRQLQAQRRAQLEQQRLDAETRQADARQAQDEQAAALLRQKQAQDDRERQEAESHRKACEDTWPARWAGFQAGLGKFAEAKALGDKRIREHHGPRLDVVGAADRRAREAHGACRDRRSPREPQGAQRGDEGASRHPRDSRGAAEDARSCCSMCSCFAPSRMSSRKRCFTYCVSAGSLLSGISRMLTRASVSRVRFGTQRPCSDVIVLVSSDRMAASHPWSRAFVAWMKRTKTPTVVVAFKCGVSSVAVHHWMHGSVPRTAARREAIERLTEGAVPASLGVPVARAS